MSFLKIRAFCLLLVLCLTFCEASNRCQYKASDKSVYDLSDLIPMADFAVSTKDAAALYHFAVCRETHVCQGAACATASRHSTVVGDIRAMEWSEEYTKDGEGITLVYGNGQSTCDENSSTRFLVTIQCDTTTDVSLTTFNPGCEQNHVVMKSRFACPVASETSDESSDMSEIPFLWVLWVLIGAGVGTALMACVLLAVCALVCVCKRRGKAMKKEHKDDDQEALVGGDYTHEKVLYPMP